jgi:hypothetical protein
MVFMVRRLVFAVIGIFLESLPFLQIQLFISHCLLVVIYLGYFRPYTTQKQNNLELFNEICILAASYHLIIFTDFVDDLDIKYQAGWSLIAITLINLIGNLTLVFIENYKSIKLFW